MAPPAEALSPDAEVPNAPLGAYSAATAIQLPSFFKEDPRAWFKAIESTFFLKKISNWITKFHHAIAKPDAETCSTVREILFAPVSASSFNHLRGLLCDLFQLTKE